MCYRCNATVLLLSALTCLSVAGCSNEKDRNKDRSTSRPAAAPDEIVVDWWETKDSKEKNRSAVIVGARIPSGMLFVPSPKNPGSLEWRYKDLKLICADGSSITAEGVHLGFHGEGAQFYKIEKFATEPGRYALTQNDSRDQHRAAARQRTPGPVQGTRDGHAGADPKSAASDQRGHNQGIAVHFPPPERLHE
jgi:hypothetical protein